MLDGGNGNTTVNVLETWDLQGCFLSQVDWGDMAYNLNDPVQIALTIKFDNANQSTTNAADYASVYSKAWNQNGTLNGTATGGALNQGG